MFKNYLKIALRNVSKHKLFSFINIFGLALSLSFCLLVIVIINDQNSFDRFHPRAGDVYRVLTVAHRKGGGTELYASSPRPLGSVLENESPAVEKVVHLASALSGEASYGQVYIRLRGFFTDPAFFDVFGFQLDRGDPAAALTLPNALVLTAETAAKIFGKEDPIGKTITIKPLTDFVVTGVVKAFPGKTHLEFDALGSAAALPQLEKEKKIFPVLDNWNNYYTNYSYVRLYRGHRADELEPLLAAVSQKYYGNLKLESRDEGYSFALQPLTQITPGPMLSNNLGRAMPETMLIFLSALALLGMVAAIFNYTNLTLARSLARAKEVGIRKVIGAGRLQLFIQFLAESVLIVLIALIGAETLLRLLLISGFKQLQLTQEINLDFVIDLKVYLFFLVFTLAIGVLAGLLPAAVISKFRPAQVLSGIAKIRVFSRITLRKALIVFQFALALVLIIVVTAIYQQIRYALRMDYGFAWENMVNIELQGNSYALVAQKMARHSEVTGYSAVSHNMGTWEDSSVDVRKSKDEEPVTVRDYSVDPHFLENFGLTLVAGANFKDDLAANKNLVLVNQRFVERFQLGAPPDAVGSTLILGDSSEVQIAGVLKDFLFKPLTYELAPMLLRYNPDDWRLLNLKLHSQDIPGALSRLEKEWKSIDPVHPFAFKFYDDILLQTYSMFRDMMFVIGFLTLLAFAISMLGLLGIATFNAETRIKEVGIRKVLGADLRNLILLLGRSEMMLLLIATVIAVPVSWWIANKLLQTFAYRIGLSANVILPGLLAVFMMSGLIVGWQALRAALTNPVESLRYE